jgi:hypothetical protein
MKNWVRIMNTVAALSFGLLCTEAASADTWTGAFQIGSLQPAVNAEGGVIRVNINNGLAVPFCGDSSGKASVIDFLFTNGTQESRSGLVAGLYTALATGASVTLLISSAGCSPYGAPVIVGMNIAPAG